MARRIVAKHKWKKPHRKALMLGLIKSTLRIVGIAVGLSVALQDSRVLFGALILGLVAEIFGVSEDINP